ncbi:hypothetical protein NOV72_05397 [Caballeronia novacaledonica]|uniref:Uncharacterized protein n=1 Tax=Caballeronia novacaledonica TaxID=1544861 RepID=A0A2U3IDC7_9BURK|nr:hypothetical protein [Caballeronia novacaledonica]SPB18198.1 hypothetical protein NOV72_05397 [Caballeronia novacaledonica]
MTRRYELEVLNEDIELVDQTSSATISMTSKVGENGVRVSVLETTEEGLAAQWAHILDGNDRAYVARVVDGNEVLSERSVREPNWRRE